VTNDGTPPRPTQPAPTPGAGFRMLDEHLIHFRTRALYDALLEATAAYWRHRATTFDTVGTPACDLIALNCRRHADLLEDIGLDAEACTVIAEILAGHGEDVA